MMESIGMAGLLALGLSILGVMVLRAPAIALGLVDQPGGRKVHARPVPLIGGVAVLLAFGLATLLLPIPLRPYGALYAGLAVIAVSGLVDDAIGLPASLRLLAQLVMATLVVVAGGPVLTDLGSFPGLGMIGLGFLAMPVTVIAIVGFVNSLNMMDGADGLAGGAAVVILSGLSVAAALAGDTRVPALALTLAAAVLGFLVFNLRTPWRRRATVFLGDGGSLALGFAVIWLAIETAMLPGRVISPLGIAWLLAVPVVETLNLIIRRLLRGQSPFHPDREHLHHILSRAGFTIGQTTSIIIALITALGATGLTASAVGVADGWLWLGLFGFGGVHFIFTERGWRSVLALQRLRNWRIADPDRARVTGIPLSPLRQSMAVIGFYLLVATLPFGLNTAMLGLAMVIGAVVVPGTRFIHTLIREPLAWAVMAAAAWIAIRMVGEGAAPLALWHCLALSGLAALPLGWWLASSPRHVPGGALVLTVSLVVTAAIASVSPDGTAGVEDVVLAGPDRLLLLAMPLPLCVALLARQLQRAGRGWLRAGPLAALALIAAAGLVAALLGASTPLIPDGLRSDAMAMLQRTGWPGLILLALVFVLLLRPLVPLYRSGVWPRYAVLALGLLAVLVLAAVTVSQPLEGVEGGLVLTLGLAVLCMGAIQYRRIR
ncbi:glycosyltransferase family 4 protein [Spiribacter vilamensis]|uniref:Undecaprenyl-phosphate alpha-N-acetylglucosaminyl 1-phosphatetransferase n=1 Tax=Spiribacter vilamensis TaxID=531306 RepID=A0A4Q8D168_9GAMM|nr:MraY family glycosyltransferase [Spiribacter vilamensis]RZU99121.1 undecaprenyl-phosphate alpha-N-acetylglucosaminyl 1-phosphatetransferase [Spiribacter vilamensis]